MPLPCVIFRVTSRNSATWMRHEFHQIPHSKRFTWSPLQLYKCLGQIHRGIGYSCSSPHSPNVHKTQKLCKELTTNTSDMDTYAVRSGQLTQSLLDIHKRYKDQQPHKPTTEELCLDQWMSDWSLLQEFPNDDIDQLIRKPKSDLFHYLFLVEYFRESYGDWALPPEERAKKLSYELAVDMKTRSKTETSRRGTLCKPEAVPRQTTKR